MKTCLLEQEKKKQKEKKKQLNVQDMGAPELILVKISS